MVAGKPARSSRAGLRVDRVVAAVAITALTLSVSIFGRTVADRISGTNLTTLAGISLLAPDDQLVTFEDFERGAPGWTGGSSDQSSAAFGGILGRFGGTDGAEGVSRTYAMPTDAEFALVSFDLHAIDDWALEDVIVFANGIEVLRRNFSANPAEADAQRALVAEQDWLRVDLRDRPNHGSGAQTMTVRMIIAGPADELRLGFGTTLPDPGTQTASWAIDNLQIVTTPTQPTS